MINRVDIKFMIIMKDHWALWNVDSCWWTNDIVHHWTHNENDNIFWSSWQILWMQVRSLCTRARTDNWKSVSHISVHASSTETWKPLYLKSTPFSCAIPLIQRPLQGTWNFIVTLYKSMSCHESSISKYYRFFWNYVDIPREWLKLMTLYDTIDAYMYFA